MRVAWILALLLGGGVEVWAAEQAPSTIVVTSPAFKDKQPLATEFTCEGRGAMPPIEWSALPPDTKTVAVVIDDPDAPGGTFVHWLAYNLSPSTHKVPLDRVASFGLNDRGVAGYTPPCPPSGQHRYRFKVLALDTRLDLRQPTFAEFERAAKGHIVASGQLEGVYQKTHP